MDLKVKTVAVFGDSIAYGSGNNDYGVGEYLSARLNLKLLKYAVGGARVGFCEGKDWVARQVKEAIGAGIRPDYIVFDGFTNDCVISEGATLPDVPLGETSRGYDGFDIFKVTKTDAFSRCFEEIVAAFLKYFPKAKILFFRPHNMGRRDDLLQRQYGERALEICAKWGVAAVDLYSQSGMNTFIPEHRDLFTADTYGWGRGDCTHPNALGYELKYMPLIEAKLKTLG
ncbi:MAG: SGNH/GDSL hydrolase family protein [Clostridia bacterium]|nr:SGNH/GDSL hydrolase family protein [Clostridia bacterium]